MKYRAMSGEYGCLPDNVEDHDTLDSAIESMTNLFELSRAQAKQLKQDAILDLPARSGSAYVEIIPVSVCSCGHDSEDHREEPSTELFPCRVDYCQCSDYEEG